MQGNKMNKKITGTAIVLIGGIYSGLAIAADAPAVSGSPIELSLGGEAELTTIFGGGVCGTIATAADVFSNELTSTSAGTITTDLVAIGFASGSTMGDVATMLFDADLCGGESVKNPTFELGRELTVSASGTLANGLTVSFDDKIDLAADANGDDWELGFEGAFGKMLFRLGGSAVDDMLAGTDGSGADVLGEEITGGHVSDTAGVGEVNVTYYAPSMGGLDLAIGYNQSTAAVGDSGLLLNDDTAYQDTFSIGMGYSMAVSDMTLTLGGGFENATISTTDCNSLATDLAAADAVTTTTVDGAEVFTNALYGSAVCGDQSLVAIGGDLEMGSITLSGAYSNLDSDGADQTVWSAGLGTTVGDISYLIGYTVEDQTFARKNADGNSVGNEARIIMAEASTALGDGVDLAVNFSSNTVDKMSQELGGGSTTAWRAGVVVTVGF
jgi:hypothetical protein